MNIHEGLICLVCFQELYTNDEQSDYLYSSLVTLFQIHRELPAQ